MRALSSRFFKRLSCDPNARMVRMAVTLTIVILTMGGQCNTPGFAVKEFTSASEDEYEEVDIPAPNKPAQTSSPSNPIPEPADDPMSVTPAEAGSAKPDADSHTPPPDEESTADEKVSAEELERRRQEAARYQLENLKHLLTKESQASDGDDGGVLFGEELIAHPHYRRYLSKAALISKELLAARDSMLAEQEGLSLQRLGAFSQNFTAEFQRFKSSLSAEELSFESFKLIETAVQNLKQAIDYWRLANQFRRWERGGVQQRQEDDSLLQLKLQKANQSITALGTIIHTRQILNQSVDPTE